MRKRFLALAALLCAAGLRAQNVGYVVDNGSSVVHVVDLRSRQVTARIPSGVEPSEMLVLPNNRLAFVSNSGSNDVAVLDLSNNVRLGTIPAGVSPGSLIASADGRFVYVANDGSDNVTIIDVAARRAVATIPVDATPVQVNLSPDGRFLYAVNQDETPGTISVIDTNRRQVVKTITVGQRPSQLAISPKQTVAYVVNSGGASLTLIDLARNDAILTIPVRNGPASVAFSTDGRFVYSINRDAASVTVIDSEQFHRIVTHIPVGTQPAAMVVTYDSKFGYVSNQGSNTVSVLDLATNTVEETIAVGRGPFSLALDPNEDFLYVTNLGAGTLSVIDVNTDRVAATIAVGAVPVQFQMLNAPTLLELAPNPSAAGSRLTLNGEGFLPTSTVRFVTTAPPRTSTAPVTFLDSQGLQVVGPSFPGASAVVSVANPDGNSSEEVIWRPGTAAPSISAGGVVEGAGFTRAPFPISGGAIVSVFGNFPGVVQQEAASFPLPSALGNAAVTFNGLRAPLLFTSTGQINLVAPIRLLALERVRVAITVSGQTSAAETTSVAASGPGIFLNAFLPAGPVRRGETVMMFVTGLGDTVPPPVDGEPAPSDVLSPTVASPLVTVGSAQTTVRFSGLAPGFSGLYQINFDVPAAAPTGAEVPVTVTAGGRLSNTVRLVVEP
jgi:uncharacterized protein (TIGR03437 family)